MGIVVGWKMIEKNAGLLVICKDVFDCPCHCSMFLAPLCVRWAAGSLMMILGQGVKVWCWEGSFW